MKTLRLVIFLCLPVGFCFAETIVLKSGKTVEGKIIEKTADHIKLDSQGVILTFFSEELGTAGQESGPQAVPPMAHGSVSSEYILPKMGFSLQEPQGWSRLENLASPFGTPILLLYRNSDTPYPTIGLIRFGKETILPGSGNAQTLLAVADDLRRRIEGFGWVPLEKPVYGGASIGGQETIRMQFRHFQKHEDANLDFIWHMFLKDDFVYVFYLGDIEDRIQESEQVLKAMMDSVKFLKQEVQ